MYCLLVRQLQKYQLALIVLSVIVFGANAAIYNSKLVYKLRGGTPTDYFGYAVALQGGGEPKVIIGAPKNGPDEVGAVFVCPAKDVDDTSTHCTPYTIDKKTIRNLVGDHDRYNNSLFGACIDAGIGSNDNIVIGAPKLMDKVSSELHYTIGGIFELSSLNNTRITKYPERPGAEVSNKNGNVEYNSAFAQFGFALHAVSNGEWIYGAPGYNHWRGEAFRYKEVKPIEGPSGARRANLRRRTRRSLAGDIQLLLRLTLDDNWLAGYAVTAGRFFGPSTTTYAIGMPNGNFMLGTVEFFTYNKRTHENKREAVRKMSAFSAGRPIGEFFGAALAAADINGDGYDDLLVGAPSAQFGDDYDNGRVYVFLSDTKGDFDYLQELTGEPKSRMGTVISNLGRITLNAHESVAIGCPYEDKGVGAVRVYIWQEGKLALDSKIQLEEFATFGYSLSRAVDVDSNKIADIAVGAYKSNAIAILKAKSVFHYTVAHNYTQLNADQNETHFEVTFCFSLHGIDDSIQTTINLELDDRIAQTYVRSTTARISTTPTCRTHKLEVMPNVHSIDPLSAIVQLSGTDCDTCPVHSPTFPTTFHIRIPYNLNCKGATCLAKLSIDTQIASTNILVGEQDKHELTVNVRNDGDPAFVCTLEISSAHAAPDAISVVNRNRCKNTECQYNYIKRSLSEKFIIDFSRWNTYEEDLDLRITLSCVNVTVTSVTSLQLKYVSRLSVATAELTKQYDSLNASTFNVMSAAIFHIRNAGPSGLKEANYILRVPRFSHDDQIVDIYMPKNGFCKPEEDEVFDTLEEYKPVNADELPTVAGFGKSASLANTVSCENPQVRCMKLRCTVESLAKDKTLVINVPLRLNITQILKNYRSTFSIQSTLQREGIDGEVSKANLDVVDRQTQVESIAAWIIVVAVLIALLILAAILGTLYKMGFFSRAKLDKLMEEMEMNKEMEAVGMRHAPEGGSSEETDEVETSVVKG